MGKRALLRDPLFKEMSNVIAALALIVPAKTPEGQVFELQYYRELSIRAKKVVDIIKRKHTMAS